VSYRITALKMQKNNRQRVSVYLDGEYAFGLVRFVAAWLQVGQEITDERIAQLQAEDSYEAAYQRALKFIDYRPRTETEIRRNLAKQELNEEIIEQTVGRLKQSGLINDGGYAQSWVENRVANRHGSRRAFTYELKKRGVDAEIIAQALDSIDDEEMAYQVALKHARRIGGGEWKTFLQKMVRYLSQRGFSYEVSSQVIPRVWDQIQKSEKYQDQEAPL
jgi:regulatory protein